MIFPQKDNKELIDVSSRSLKNLNRELTAIGDIVDTMNDIDDIKVFVHGALEELCYNISLLVENVEYRSDEYSFIYDSMRECE